MAPFCSFRGNWVCRGVCVGIIVDWVRSCRHRADGGRVRSVVGWDLEFWNGAWAMWSVL